MNAPTAFAPAKVNLYLHVGALEADGRHPLGSLMVFADVGDQLATRPADSIGMEITGPFSDGLSAGPDNLVMRAARAIAATPGARAPRAVPPDPGQATAAGRRAGRRIERRRRRAAPAA